MKSQVTDMKSLSNIFNVAVFLLSELVTGSGSGVLIIFVYKRLIRNPEIRKIPVWVLRNMWRLGKIKNEKFDTNFSNKMFMNAVKYQGHSFYRS